MSSTSTYRAAVAVWLLGALALVWLIGAVGIITVEGDRADLMYVGVLAVGVVGAVLARFRARGMAVALTAMAVATGVAAVVAMVLGRHEDPVTSVPELLGLNAMFAVWFLASAWLFRRAALLQDGNGGSRTA